MPGFSKTTLPAVLAAVLGSCFVVSPLTAQPLDFEDFQVTVEDSSADDLLGFAVDATGDLAIVGAPHMAWWTTSIETEAPGRVFVHRRDGDAGWPLEQELVPSLSEDDDRFGFAVSITEDLVAVGSPGESSEGSAAGAAYVFRLDDEGEWIEEQVLFASDASLSDEFGSSVVIRGDRLLVGARDADGEGAVYCFEFDSEDETWTEVQRLSASDGASGDEFGNVDMDGDVAIVGAPSDDGDDTNAGSAYIFRRDETTGEWSEEQKLLPPDPDAFVVFGCDVSIDGSTVAIGSHGLGDEVGGAYVFVHDDDSDTWELEQQINAEDQVCCLFGHSVELLGRTLAVGAPWMAKGGNEGSVYVFRKQGDSWRQLVEIESSTGADDDQVGHSVALAGATVIFGSPRDDDIAVEAGSFYGVRVADCNDNHVFDDLDIATGTSEDCNGNGIPDECDLGRVLPTAELAPGDEVSDTRFGGAVALSGRFALAGARSDREQGPSSGAVYVFENSGRTWIEEQKLLAEDGDSLDWFGHSVALSGPVAAIGAPRNDAVASNAGAVYVMGRSADDDSWSQLQRLTASDGEASDNLGESVATSGNVVVAGAPKRDEDGSSSGSVYVYTFDGAHFDESQRLEAGDAEEDDHFGQSVALDATRLVVGSPLEDESGSNAGAVYVFEYDENKALWSESQKLLASDGLAGDEFGTSVAVLGDLVVVGAPEATTDDVTTGACYVFRHDDIADAYVEEQRLTASDADQSDRFGISVSVSESLLVVGASGHDLSAGAAYVFRFDGEEWLEVDTLTPPGFGDDGELGISVAMDGPTVVAGALFAGDPPENETGAAYLFVVADCDGNEELDVCEIDDGDKDDCDDDGVPDACHLNATRVDLATGDRTACVGEELVLEALTTAFEPEFQWLREGAEIPDATGGSLVIEDLSEADAGSYEVRVDGACGSASAAVDVTVCIVEPSFLRGDANNTLTLTLGDGLVTLNWLFLEGDAPCLAALDANDDGDIAFGDALRVLNFVFNEGVPPANPYPDCGMDDTPGDLDCETRPDCP